MRTTLTIDDNIMEQIKDRAHSSGLPVKQVVNSVLEIGLRHMNACSRQEYRLPTFSMGVPRGISLDKALQLAAELENDEISRKLEILK